MFGNWSGTKGYRDGKWIAYYKNGKVKSEGYYEEPFLFGEGHAFEGYEIGKWKYYYPNGQLKKIENYDNPLFWDGPYKDGKWITYYENGEKEYEKEYSDPWIWGKSELKASRKFINEKLKKDLKAYDDFILNFWEKNFEKILPIFQSRAKAANKPFKQEDSKKRIVKNITPIIPIKWGGEISRNNLFLVHRNLNASEKFKNGFPTEEQLLRAIISNDPADAFLYLKISQFFIQDSEFLELIKSITPYFKPQNIRKEVLSNYAKLPNDQGGVYLQQFRGQVQYVGKVQKSMGFRKRMSDECNGNQNMKPRAAQMLHEYCRSINTFILPIRDEEILQAEKNLIKLFGGPYTKGGELWNAQE